MSQEYERSRGEDVQLFRAGGWRVEARVAASKNHASIRNVTNQNKTYGEWNQRVEINVHERLLGLNAKGLCV